MCPNLPFGTMKVNKVSHSNIQIPGGQVSYFFPIFSYFLKNSYFFLFFTEIPIFSYFSVVFFQLPYYYFFSKVKRGVRNKVNQLLG